MQLDQRNNMVRKLETVTKKRPFGEAEETLLVLNSQRGWSLEEDGRTLKEVVYHKGSCIS